MKQVLGALCVVAGVSAVHPVVGVLARGVSEPQTLYWERNGQPNSGTAVGLLYPPEALAALAARVPADTVPATIVAAVSQRTPIAAMWEDEGPRDRKPQLPYHVAVVNDAGGPPLSIPAIWIQQHAGDLGRLDARLVSHGKRVAAIAAFPASAFVPGRRVLISSTHRPSAGGGHTWSQRWGVIRWDGAVASR